jgi:phage tail sheath protein FI
MLSPSLVNGLNSKGYIFLIKHSERAGTYFNDSHTATVVTSDYAFIESNRTIDKAIRGCRSFLLPDLNSPIFVNPDGTLTEDTIAGLKNSAARALEQMERDGEISTFQVVINPTQDTISTGKVIITIKIVPVGVARNIEVNIGFAVRIN